MHAVMISVRCVASMKNPLNTYILQCGVISEKMGSKISVQFVDSEDVEELRETARYMRRAVRIIEECNYLDNQCYPYI